MSLRHKRLRSYLLSLRFLDSAYLIIVSEGREKKRFFRGVFFFVFELSQIAHFRALLICLNKLIYLVFFILENMKDRDFIWAGLSMTAGKIGRTGNYMISSKNLLEKDR